MGHVRGKNSKSYDYMFETDQRPNVKLQIILRSFRHMAPRMYKTHIDELNCKTLAIKFNNLIKKKTIHCIRISVKERVKYMLTCSFEVRLCLLAPAGPFAFRWWTLPVGTSVAERCHSFRRFRWN